MPTLSDVDFAPPSKIIKFPKGTTILCCNDMCRKVIGVANADVHKYDPKQSSKWDGIVFGSGFSCPQCDTQYYKRDDITYLEHLHTTEGWKA